MKNFQYASANHYVMAMKEYGGQYRRVHRHAHLRSDHKSKGEDFHLSPSFPKKSGIMSEQAMDLQCDMIRQATHFQNEMVNNAANAYDTQVWDMPRCTLERVLRSMHRTGGSGRLDKSEWCTASGIRTTTLDAYHRSDWESGFGNEPKYPTTGITVIETDTVDEYFWASWSLAASQCFKNWITVATVNGNSGGSGHLDKSKWCNASGIRTTTFNPDHRNRRRCRFLDNSHEWNYWFRHLRSRIDNRWCIWHEQHVFGVHKREYLRRTVRPWSRCYSYLVKCCPTCCSEL